MFNCIMHYIITVRFIKCAVTNAESIKVHRKKRNFTTNQIKNLNDSSPDINFI